ncbi:helix-turn-helix domain-containing protein, partial [Actinomadura chokoriensis]|uniref:helix-turn-helix domain-containing protein n=1 Tax=Actinomadura chokoriensis TaxID=454156 RepID=UPI0035634A5C
MRRLAACCWYERGRFLVSVATRSFWKDLVVPGRRLTLGERAQIEVLFGEGRLIPQIAEVIGRHRSTVWREVRRNNSYR